MQESRYEPQIAERVMVSMSASVSAPRVLRTGARMAERLGARWYAVYVETRAEGPERIKPADREQLQRNVALAESLGATVVRVKAESAGGRPGRLRAARGNHSRHLRSECPHAARDPDEGIDTESFSRRSEGRRRASRATLEVA